MSNEILMAFSVVYLFFIVQSMGNSLLSSLSFRSALMYRKEEEFVMVDSKLNEFEKYLKKTGENLIFSTVSFGLILFFEYMHFDGFYLPETALVIFTIFIVIGWVLTIIHQFLLKNAIDRILSQRGKSAKTDTG